MWPWQGPSKKQAKSQFGIGLVVSCVVVCFCCFSPIGGCRLVVAADQWWLQTTGGCSHCYSAATSTLQPPTSLQYRLLVAADQWWLQPLLLCSHYHSAATTTLQPLLRCSHYYSATSTSLQCRLVVAADQWWVQTTGGCSHLLLCSHYYSAAPTAADQWWLQTRGAGCMHEGQNAQNHMRNDNLLLLLAQGAGGEIAQ